MRSFAECKKIYDSLNQVDFTDMGGADWCVAALRIKWLSAVTHFIYPDYIKTLHRYHMTTEKKVMDGNIGIEDVGDFLLQSCIINGEVADYALIYMNKSPFWQIDYDYAKIQCEDEYGQDEEMNEVEMEPSDFLRGRFENFFEKGFFEGDMKIIKQQELMNVFNLYDKGEVTDEICAIRADLFPYVKKAKEVAGCECEEMLCMVDRAFHTIEVWLDLCEVHFDTPGAAYFFSLDGSASIYEGWSGFYGALDFDPAIIICAELIEAALFEIHDKYPFLPDHVVKRRLK